MFYKCPKLKFVSVPDTIYEIETDCFYDCNKLQIITFGLDSRLTTLGNNHSSFVFCIGPSRFFRISHDLRLWRSIYTPWQRAPLGIEHDHYHCCFEEVCEWSPEHYIREMEANMWPQKSQTKE